MSAQDTITMKSGTVVIGSIVGFDSSNVFVNQPNTRSDIAIPLATVQQIRFGTVAGSMLFKQHRDTTLNKRNAVFACPFSPVFSHLCVGFEHSFKPGFAFIVNPGYIFQGPVSDDMETKGAYLKAGIRIYQLQEQYSGINGKQHLTGDFYQFTITGMRYTFIQELFDTWDLTTYHRYGKVTELIIGFDYGFQSRIYRNLLWGMKAGFGYSFIYPESAGDENVLANTIEFIHIRPLDNMPISINGQISFAFKF